MLSIDKFIIIIIIKLHNNPRRRSNPLEMATVTVDTSKCDHNTKTAMLQRQFPQSAAHRAKRESNRSRSNTADDQGHRELGNTNCRPTCDHKLGHCIKCLHILRGRGVGQIQQEKKQKTFLKSQPTI